MLTESKRERGRERERERKIFVWDISYPRNQKPIFRSFFSIFPSFFICNSLKSMQHFVELLIFRKSITIYDAPRPRITFRPICLESINQREHRPRIIPLSHPSSLSDPRSEYFARVLRITLLSLAVACSFLSERAWGTDNENALDKSDRESNVRDE